MSWTIGLACSAVLLAQEPQQVTPTNYASEKDIFYLPQQEAEATPFERERCRLDVYYPEGRPRFATLIWLHGGGLWGGDRKIDPYLTDLFPRLKQEGIALVSIDYRLEIDAGILTI
ncbi:MAG: hypothetical protein GXX96_38925 [Planctomycetaceae bacterium]|nr:hypothetical protein [Planctomycetaceae bacterium]